MGRFLPHLQRAMQLGQRLEQANIERQAALDAAERTDASVIVVDRDGFVCYANRRAEVTLRRADGLRAKDGWLWAINQATSQRLSNLIRGAAETAAGHGDCAGA